MFFLSYSPYFQLLLLLTSPNWMPQEQFTSTLPIGAHHFLPDTCSSSCIYSLNSQESLWISSPANLISIHLPSSLVSSTLCAPKLVCSSPGPRLRLSTHTPNWSSLQTPVFLDFFFRLHTTASVVFLKILWTIFLSYIRRNEGHLKEQKKRKESKEWSF